MFDVTQNPFVYGEVVPAAAFVDRVVELERLVGDLAAAQKVFLISPRRYGKSSLIRLALVRDEPPGDRDSAAAKASFEGHLHPREHLRERALQLFIGQVRGQAAKVIEIEPLGRLS